jgi:hypothetical protein
MKVWGIEELKSLGGLRGTREGNAPDDLFLVSASYEGRTLAAAQSFAPDYRAQKGIIYFNKEILRDPNNDNAKINLDNLTEMLNRHCDVIDQVEGSWRDPRLQLIALRKAIAPADAGQPTDLSITIDTTTFNRESLLTTSALLRTHYPDSTIRVLYTSPNKHGEWLSHGFRHVRNVMSFAGIQQSSLPTLLVVLSGFEPERTLKIIEEHEPSKVLLGIGDPPTNQQFLERNLNDQKLILARQEVEKFSFPTSNITECWRCLETLLDPYLKSYNITLAPMSTKLSTLAVFLTAERHSEFQITYCVPGEYNTEDYSAGADKIFIDELPNKKKEGNS